MRPTEAVFLAGYIRAHFPSQPIDDYTADALSELLEPYPLEACRAAVLRIAMRNHEGDSGRAKWCSPTDVYAEVRRQRAKLIAEAGDLTPPPGLTPEETSRWTAECRRRIGDGEPVDVVAPPLAVTAPTRDVIRELGEVRHIDSALISPARQAVAAARMEAQAVEGERQKERAEKQARMEAMRAADRAARGA